MDPITTIQLSPVDLLTPLIAYALAWLLRWWSRPAGANEARPVRRARALGSSVPSAISWVWGP